MIKDKLNLSNEQKNTESKPKSSAGYNPSYIHIDGSISLNWSNTANNYDWCNFDGVRYIIENVTINAVNSPTGSGILINNSKNKYFIIRNCTIFNADGDFIDSGIRLENTNNGTIFNNTCSDNNQGIYLENSDKNNITENKANNNKWNGIYIDADSDKNTITENTANENMKYGIQLNNNCDYNNITYNTANNNGVYGGTDKFSGIYINSNQGYCENNFILNNTINENMKYGIFIEYTNYENLVINNTIKNNILKGIYMYKSFDFNLTGNIIENNTRGIELIECNNSNIINNTIKNNLEIGIYLWESSDNNKIENNTINKNDLGIRLDESNYNNITGNILRDNNWCIFETNCEGTIIEYNDCSLPTVDTPIFIDGTAIGVGAHNWTWVEQQSWFGGGLGSKEQPYIIKNLRISGFGVEDGISIQNSNVFIIIQGCEIYNSLNGIHIENTNNSLLIDNNCSNNKDSGIFLENYCYYNNISENTLNNNEDYGIYLNYNINYTIISGNTLIDNNDGGITLSDCGHSNITGNTATNNSDYGLRLEGNNVYNIIMENDFDGNHIGINLYGKSDFNTVVENNVSYNSEVGIYLQDYCYNNTIINNNVNDNLEVGINLQGNCYNNTIIDNNVNDNSDDGILLNYDCTNNIISENTLKNNDNGIKLDTNCYYNNIRGNNIEENLQDGILLFGGGEESCNYNEITNNIFNSNTRGISVDSKSNNNILYENVFLANGIHAIDNGTDNKWNNTIRGNYWDNLTGPDVNSDGIVDSEYRPYNISGSTQSKDYFPIAENGPPSITINSPNSGDIFGITAPFFNVIITDTLLDTMWYTVDGGLNNYTFTDNGMINLDVWDATDEGDVTLTFYARDILGNISTADVNIIKDNIAPTININTPSLEEVFGSNSPSFNVGINEDYLVTMWYTIDNGLNNYTFTTNNTVNQTIWDNMADGSIILTFYAIDDLGHIGSSKVTIIKDTVAPSININSPTEGETFGNTAPQFNINVIETNLDEKWYSFNGGSTNYTIINNGTFDQTAWTALSQGEITITFYASDFAGNEASESVTVIKSVSSGLDAGVIIIIVVVSVVGGVAVISVVYIFMKKRGST